MNRAKLGVLAALAVAGALGAVRAEDDEATPEAVARLVEAGRLEDAIAVASSGTRLPDAERARRFELALAVARAVRLARTRQGKTEDTAKELDKAADRARPEDLGLVRQLAHAASEAVPYARVLERAVLRSIAALDDDPRLLALAQDQDALVRRRAVEGIARRVAKLRRKVEEGGALTQDEQGRLADRGLIDVLVLRLEDRTKAQDGLAPDLAADAGASALHALALIETPALATLESAVRRGSSDAAAALRAVRAAIELRLRRQPRSTWSSAAGTTPSAGIPTAPCDACGKPLPAVAAACPACGKKATGAPCPRCGVPFREGGWCAACGGGPLVAGDGKVCKECSGELAPDAAFCKRCGAPRAGWPKKKTP